MDIVDTDVRIDVQRGFARAVAWFGAPSRVPAIPGFVVMELIQDARNAREIQQSLQLIAPLQIIWPSETDCDRALELYSIYHLSQGLGMIDALVAACAIG